MLPHPALCKVVNLVDDLGGVNIEISEEEISGVYLCWLRPSVISREAHSDRVQIRILASVSRFLCVYDVVSFQEFESSDEVRVELRLTSVWTMFDSVNGVSSISDSIVALLMGSRGVYIYQIVEDYDGFNSTTRLTADNRLSVVMQASPGDEDERRAQEAYLVIKGRQIGLVSQVSEMLVCIHRYADHSRRLFVVSQSLTNDLQESVDLFTHSFVQCRTGRHVRVMLLLNDRIVSILMLFKSWIPFLEAEFNSNMEQIKCLVYDNLSWTRLLSSFIALYENRLPGLQTWISVDKRMVLNIIRNILNSLLDSVAGFHSRIQDCLLEDYLRQVMRLILDSSVRLQLWEYLFEELTAVVQSYRDVQLSLDLAGQPERGHLLDYYLMSVVGRLIRGEVSWELLEGDFLRLLISWYKSHVVRLERLRAEGGLGSSAESRIEQVLREAQFVMVRVLRPDLQTLNPGGGNPWLVFVPLFKKYGFWTSYILLYLLSGRDPGDLFRRIIAQMSDLLTEELSRARHDEAEDGERGPVGAIDMMSQSRLEGNRTVQSYYYYIYSLFFRDAYPFDDYEISGLESSQLGRVSLSLDTGELIRALCEETSVERLSIAQSNCDLLALTSIRLYMCLLTELRRRKRSLLPLTEEGPAESDGGREERIVRFEKLYLIMEERLELLIYRVLRAGGPDGSPARSHSVDSGATLSGGLDLKTEILEGILGRSDGLGTSLNYFLGSYLNWQLFSTEGETDYRLVIGCFFKVVENLDKSPEQPECVSGLRSSMEYNLIMAIIASNRRNEGVNFLNMFLSCLGLDGSAPVEGGDQLSEEDSRLGGGCNKVEMNQRLCGILKRHSLYNLSLYLSIQVYDLESILDMYSKKHFINSDILRELYIMDEDDNNILFSLSYILSTIEKGINYRVFDYDQVFILITRYTDLLIKIDSLNTIDLIIDILRRCLDDEFNSKSRNTVAYYVQTINGLDARIRRLLLGRLLLYQTDESRADFLEELLLSGKTVYESRTGLERWNELINELIPPYLESRLAEGRDNDSSILGVLDYWYQSSARCDALLTTPFGRCFQLCKEHGNEYGMLRGAGDARANLESVCFEIQELPLKDQGAAGGKVQEGDVHRGRKENQQRQVGALLSGAGGGRGAQGQKGPPHSLGRARGVHQLRLPVLLHKLQRGRQSAWVQPERRLHRALQGHPKVFAGGDGGHLRKVRKQDVYGDSRGASSQEGEPALQAEAAGRGAHHCTILYTGLLFTKQPQLPVLAGQVPPPVRVSLGLAVQLQAE
ncbi:hypothetical protein OIY81_3293 [Cryptosporidium canis]|nr:hypothetical protein OIY81_3293 [Cryptosporidium canis]